MNSRVATAVRQLGEPHERQNALKYAREIFKLASQGPYLSNGARFDLAIECLGAAGFRLTEEYAEAFPEHTLDLFEESNG